MPEYEKDRLERALQRQSERLQRRTTFLHGLGRRFSLYRLAVFLIALPATMLAVGSGGAVAGWITGLIAAGIFLFLMNRHDRVEQSRKRHELLHRITLEHLARMRLDWTGIPPLPNHRNESAHSFASDLSITGERSVHQLLDTTASVGGAERLRSWLLNPLDTPAEIKRRQQRIRELIPLSGFRNRLMLYGSEVARSRWETKELFTWLNEEAPERSLLPIVLPLAALALLNIVLFVLWLTAAYPPFWIYSLTGYLVVHGIIYARWFSRLQGFAVSAANLKYALDRVQNVLLYLEQSPHTRKGELAVICEPLHRTGARPSEAVRSLARIARGAGLQHNVFAWAALNILAPWNLFFYDRLNRYRLYLRGVLPLWLDSVYETETLAALAHYAWLNPSYTFPEVRTPSAGEALLETQSIGHPLLRDNVRVKNDFTLREVGDIALITGSNMSGKSTFLRTVGVNLVLAFCGSVVTAGAFRVAPMRLFSSMSVSDSVIDGISFFYAEVRRLKLLLTDARSTDSLPLFFLIDEIFRGTNNRERLIGSRAFIRALAGTNAIGLVSTHDLELVHLEEEIPSIANYHFREEVENGRMVFEYTIRRGPCPTTNALRIMEIEGLPV